MGFEVSHLSSRRIVVANLGSIPHYKLLTKRKQKLSSPPTEMVPHRRPRQTSRREDCHIVRNARVQPTASSVTIQAQVAPSSGPPVSSRTIRRRLAEGHLESRCSLRVLPLTPTHRCLRLEWCHVRGNWSAAEWNQIVFRDESRFNLSSDDNRVRVSQEPFFNKTMLGLTRQGWHKTVSALLLLFLGLSDPQICLQSSISGIIWDGELVIRRV
ncbi:transposable element Tcb2 transposase [Trichonephila clavipes]|nr:transposable element Tcb2 transposase [Trichonephila clavipes]